MIHRKFIDWKKTGRNLQLLREDNIELRRCVCHTLKHDKGECGGECGACRFEMDNHISRKELADVFGVSESVIFNWENGRTAVGLEDMLFYAQIAKKNLSDIIIYL
ncbi:MAG: helix-turn-helix domain-containing protein [Clostridiales bacterium]|nr:helix-turn-helix domain-containing protein [Clostridiales bacterium]